MREAQAHGFWPGKALWKSTLLDLAAESGASANLPAVPRADVACHARNKGNFPMPRSLKTPEIRAGSWQ